MLDAEDGGVAVGSNDAPPEPRRSLQHELNNSPSVASSWGALASYRRQFRRSPDGHLQTAG
jgi:hypothetical protein